MAYVDASDGSKVAEFEYSPSPEVIVKSGEKADELAQVASFSTMPWDRHLNAFIYPFRIFKDGRFISRDPVDERGGENLYGCASNDFINNFDLFGLKSYTLVVGTMYSTENPHDGRIIDDKETVKTFWRQMKKKYENPPDVCFKLITDATTENVVDAVEKGEVFIIAHGFPFFKRHKLNKSKSLWVGGFADEAFLEALGFETKEQEQYLKQFEKEVERWERLKKRYDEKIRKGKKAKPLPPYPKPHKDWEIDIRLEHFRIKAQMSDKYATMEMLIPRAPKNPKTNFVTFYGCYAGYAKEPTIHGITVKKGHQFKRTVYFMEAMVWIERDLKKLIQSSK